MARTRIKEVAPLMRLSDVLGVFPISVSRWQEGVASGEFPKPFYPMGKKIAFYRGEEIAALIDKCLAHDNDNEARER